MTNTLKYSWFMVMVVVVALVKGPIMGRCQPSELGKIYDISHTIVSTMPVWNSQTGAGKNLLSETRGHVTYYGTMHLSTTSGTHVESPSHFFQDWITTSDVTTLDLHTLNGPVLVVETPKDIRNITGAVLTALNIPANTKRVLLKTANTLSGLMKITAFTPNYSGLTADGAEWIVKAGIKLIGIDYLSISIMEEIGAVHRTLLAGKDIIPVETLNLDEVNPGSYTLRCLPLSIVGADGSPARCILIE